VTLMLAGHETTATTLAWMVDLLLHHPHALAKVQAEAETAESTAYLQAVINETLRIRPPSPFTGRYTATDYQLGGYCVPAKTRVVPHIVELNLNAATYDDPHEFRSERFLRAVPSRPPDAGPAGASRHRIASASRGSRPLSPIARHNSPERLPRQRSHP
jgi:cytochrome P450